VSLPRPRARPAEADAQIGRRVFLAVLGLGAAGVLVGKRVGNWVSGALAPLEAADRTGFVELLPGVSRFRIYSVTGSLPSRSVADYRLRVRGLVDQPLSLSVADLRAMPPTHLVKDFQCVTGWRVPAVRWSGVRLSEVLAAAGVQSRARALRLHSFDGTYTESLTLTQARRADVIVAYEMEGRPLTRAHGGPVRLYVAPMYGYKSCKWLAEIEVTDRVVPGYWEQADNGAYDVDAWIGKSNGRDDRPVD